MTGSDSEEDDEDDSERLRERMACMVQLGTRGEKTTCEERDAMLMRSGRCFGAEDENDGGTRELSREVWRTGRGEHEPTSKNPNGNPNRNPNPETLTLKP